MFKLFMDTCVWLDLAKEHKHRALIEAIEHLVRINQATLIVPRIVLEEFSRNKARIVDDATRSLSSALKRAKQAFESLGPKKDKRKVVRHLQDLDHKLPTLGEQAIEIVGRIEALFAGAQIIEATDATRVRALNRGVLKKAPFHRNKNSAADALLIEMYAELVANNEKGVRYAFITHNIQDFSDTKQNNKLPHPDIAMFFSRIKSIYCITAADAIRRMSKELIPSIADWEEYAERSRGAGEIAEAIDLLIDQVWYNRHKMREEMIEADQIMLVDKATYPRKPGEPNVIQKDIWAGALKGAARVEKQHGLENLGPWDDFEWGMVNGKLSALRWVLGDEWDMLDT